jgi:uncharacterized protein (TIGR03437 family)
MQTPARLTVGVFPGAGIFRAGYLANRRPVSGAPWAATSTLLIAALGLWPAEFARAQTVTFDFDTGTPTLTLRQNIPLDQTSGGVTAHFSAPTAFAFSIQSDASTGWRMSQFSGQYLSSNNQAANPLDIKFSQQLTSIALTFATADFQQVEVPTTIRLTAYMDSTSTPAVGSATAHGTYASDTMPMGKISFNSGGRPFNLVEITIPSQAAGAGAYYVDNIIVTTGSAVLTSVSAAAYTLGGPVAANSIASGFGANLSTGTGAANSLPLPVTLANTTVKVKDSAGTERQAPLFYVGPLQVNYLVPDSTAVGPATVTVTSGGQVTATGAISVNAVAPGIFTANQNGAGVPVAQATSLAPDQTVTYPAVFNCGAAAGSCVAVPIDLGPSGTSVVLTLYGTGIRGRSSLAAATARIGGVDAQVQYAGEQSLYVGLDQVNVAIPRTLAGQGAVDLALTVDGKAANTVRINIK